MVIKLTQKLCVNTIKETPDQKRVPGYEIDLAKRPTSLSLVPEIQGGF